MHATAYYQTHASTPMKTVLELGGGFGRCLRDCLSINPIETAYYVDLPFNVGIAAKYLEACFPRWVNLVWAAQDERILGKINILVLWLIDKIEEPIDLMINFLSLQHMPQVTMNHYFDTLIAPTMKYLYYENRMRPRSHHKAEGSLLDVVARQQFFIHAGPEKDEKNLAFNITGKEKGVLPIIVAEFLVNKALQVWNLRDVPVKIVQPNPSDLSLRLSKNWEQFDSYGASQDNPPEPELTDHFVPGYEGYQRRFGAMIQQKHKQSFR